MQTEVSAMDMGMKSKYCELDPKPTTTLKLTLLTCTLVLTDTINKSLGEGKFCKEQKTARVKPLIKKQGMDLEKSNYCPVSNLPFLSKMVEKAMLRQFNNHCHKYKILPDYQLAYWENYSMETALLKLTKNPMGDEKARNNGSYMYAVDMVDHGILLHVLNKVFGITDTVLKWFASYLRPRNLRLSANGKHLLRKKFLFSVPQGSCAGATIFNAYASTLGREIPDTLSMIGFADDHVVNKSFRAKSHEEEEEIITVIEDCMKNFKSWMDAVQLKMNRPNTEFIYFGNWKQISICTATSLDVNSVKRQRSDIIQYLGAWLDISMAMNNHIKKNVQQPC